MNIKPLAERIKLVTLNTGAWRAQRLNAKETATLNKKHGTGDAAKVIVRLTDNVALRSLYKLHAEAYAEHRRQTLPSIQDGIRIVPCGREFLHSKLMGDFAKRHADYVASFIGDYDAIKAEAEEKLNGLFDPSQWPVASVCQSKFSFAVRYLPCPSDGAWGEWIAETAETGQAELRERLVSSARHLATVLKSDGKLYQSALDNLKDVCELAGDGFNLMDDPIIAQAATQLIVPARQTAESLRDAKAVRQATADKVSSILGSLNLA